MGQNYFLSLVVGMLRVWQFFLLAVFQGEEQNMCRVFMNYGKTESKNAFMSNDNIFHSESELPNAE